MNNILGRWYGGYLCVEIKGYGIERFINLCVNNKLFLYNIEKFDGRIRFNIDIQSYKKIDRIVKKTHIIPRIIGKYGFPFLLVKAKKRKSFFIGIFIGILLFYICSLFIWEIDIEGDNYYADYELIDYLKNENVKCGMLIKNVKCKEVEDSIRNNYKDIGWVSAQVKGTRLCISIKENIKFNNTSNKEENRHIIAPIDGKITNLVVKKGESKVTIGDKVKKGQVLVHGVMEIVNDEGKVINKHGVCADADIGIQCDREYYYIEKRKYNKKIYTDKKKTKVELIWCKKDVFFIWPFISLKKIDNYDVLVNNYNVSLGQNLEVPLEIVKYNEREYKEEKRLYTDKELLSRAQRHFNRYREELKKENVDIIDSRIDNYLDDTSLYSKGYVTLQYNDMKYKRIEKKELVIDKIKEENHTN